MTPPGDPKFNPLIRRVPHETMPAAYLQTLAEFLAEQDPPMRWVFPGLLPAGVIMLLHGEPRSRKSLAAFELALSAATGTAPFGLERFTPTEKIGVLYVQEEDPRSLTRTRLRHLVQHRCGEDRPDRLHVAVRRGVDLDDDLWVDRLIEDILRLDVKFLILDAARRLSVKTDEGPMKVRELTAVLRTLVTYAGVTIAIVHHDVKPPTTGQDQRRRSQRASGGDWFAACECPVHVEKIGARDSLVFPEEYKFAEDPPPFTFSTVLEGEHVTRLVGSSVTTEQAERAGLRGKVLDWLRANPNSTKTAMKQAGMGRWETIEGTIAALMKEGKVDAGPGRKEGSFRYFVPNPEPSPSSRDDSPSEPPF